MYGSSASLAKFSVPRYQRMIESGILTSEDRVELLENYVVLKMPKNPPHDGTLDLVKAALASLPAGWMLRVQQTIVLSDSQPEPDLPSFAVGREATFLDIRCQRTSGCSLKSPTRRSFAINEISHESTPARRFQFIGSSTWWIGELKSIRNHRDQRIVPRTVAFKHTIWATQFP
jgi:hypothetical protein